MDHNIFLMGIVIGMEPDKPLPKKNKKNPVLVSGTGNFGVFVDSELGKYTTVTLHITKKQEAGE